MTIRRVKQLSTRELQIWRIKTFQHATSLDSYNYDNWRVSSWFQKTYYLSVFRVWEKYQYKMDPFYRVKEKQIMYAKR
jgi:hypothetical protein